MKAPVEYCCPASCFRKRRLSPQFVSVRTQVLDDEHSRVLCGSVYLTIFLQRLKIPVVTVLRISVVKRLSRCSDCLYNDGLIVVVTATIYGPVFCEIQGITL